MHSTTPSGRTGLEAGPAPVHSWQDVRNKAIGHLDGLITLHRDIWSVVDPNLADLCRRRIAQLLGAPRWAARQATAVHGTGPPPTSDDLRNWPRSPAFGAIDRAALAFTEQFVVDVGGVDEALVAGLREHMSGGDCYALVNAIWVFEAVLRAILLLDAAVTPAALGLADLLTPGANA